MSDVSASLKLYVWVDPYPVKYGSSMVVAVADSEDAARQQAAKGKQWAYGSFEQPGTMERIALGAPTRVVPLPCAEWYEWSE